MLSVNNAKSFGETVMYSDQIVLRNSKNQQYFINVTEEQVEQFEVGLEVNGSEEFAPFKICQFMDIREYERRESVNNLQVGDIVKFQNRDRGGSIGLAMKTSFTDNLQVRRKVIFDYDSRESVTFLQPYYDPYQSSRELTGQYQIRIEKYGDSDEDSNQINVQWEIQRKENFDSSLPTFLEPVRLRNVSTGMYLALGEGGSLKLLSSTLDVPEQYFYFIPKKAVLQESKYLRFDLQVQIMGFYKGKQFYLYCLDDAEIRERTDEAQDPLVNQIGTKEKRMLSKNNLSKCLFEIKAIPKNFKQTADRISSLKPYLNQFYIFLQDWGMRQSGPKLYYLVSPTGAIAGKR